MEDVAVRLSQTTSLLPPARHHAKPGSSSGSHAMGAPPSAMRSGGTWQGRP
jgi:hypothetical protein